MLTELRVQNLAIIERVHLTLGPGLTVLTGETGAGKSILLDAVQLLLGARADTLLIREGADRAYVEGIFTLTGTAGAQVREWLAAEDLLDPDAPDRVILAREVRRQGRHIARLNGRSVSVALLRKVGAALVDIHGQAAHLSLLRVPAHRALLDRFARAEPLLQAYRATYDQLREVDAELERLRALERDAARQADLLRYQIEEITAARPDPAEEAALRAERTRLAHAEQLASLVQQALLVLDEGLPDAPAVTDALGQVVDALEHLAAVDASQADLAAQAQTHLEGLSDLARALRDYAEQLEFNPRRLDEVESRLALLDDLKRKYGPTLDDVLTFAQKAQAELDAIETAGDRIAALEARRDALRREAGQRAWELSQARRAAADRLAQQVEQGLQRLRMAAARFRVHLATRADPHGLPLPNGETVAYDAHGVDQVEFLIAPNPGEGFKPLAKIASGGETSRLMLALKAALAQADPVPTLIFDEIDQGIGGRVSAVVGAMLWELARHHQVLCVTHLPQLAAFGDQHLRVEKVVDGQRTRTLVRPLTDPESRLAELASMLGGDTPTNRAAAQALWRQAQNQRSSSNAA